jgi:hypothetical protein
LLYETLREAWEATVAGETLSLSHKADVPLAITHAVRSAVQVLELMYRTITSWDRTFFTTVILSRDVGTCYYLWDSIPENNRKVSPNIFAITRR